MIINQLYQNTRVLRTARKEYEQETPKNIRLQTFFHPKIFKLLQQKLHQQKYTARFHPYKYSYSTTKLKEMDSFIKGTYFKNIINNLLGIKKYKITYEIQRFQPGNFTLLHDANKEPPGIDFIIDLSTTHSFYGGYIKYLTEKKELLQLNPCPNSISFVNRGKGIMKYVKYVTHQQKKPLIFVRGSLSPL